MNPLWNVSYCEDIFGEKKLLILIYNLPMFSFIVGIFCLRSLCIFQPRSWRCSSVFSSKIFFVLPFTFKSEILLNLFLLIGFKVEVFSYGFQLSQHYLLRKTILLLTIPVFHLCHVKGDHICVNLFLDSILFHWSVCFSLYQYHTILIVSL